MRAEGRDRTIVVGGGLGGLAAACTLAARGHGVLLLERNEWLGGKAAVLEEGGFRFDMGPTILTLPSVLRRIFGEAGRDLEEELDLVELDPQWRCFFEDGARLDLCADPAPMGRRLAEFADPSTARGYGRFMDVSERLHRLADRYFFWSPVGGMGDILRGSDRGLLERAADLWAMRMGRTVAGLVRQHLPDERAAQMADHFTQYVGSNPFEAPAILCGIAHMQIEERIWYPLGGMGQIPAALARLAADLGVEVRTGVAVDSILAGDVWARGVVTADGQKLPAATVVSNVDSVRTYRELLGGAAWRHFRHSRPCVPACSGVVLYLGLDRRYEQLLHHNFVFSADPQEEFRAIYGRGEPAPDPTCYVCAPAATDPSVAPEGGEALYVLVHTPHLRADHHWSEMLPEYRRVILEKLARTAGLSDLADHIKVERQLTPEDIESRYRVLQGAIYGLASHGRFTGAFKPSNRSSHLRGLYLAGGSAHPGPGVPMALMSGWIAADALDEDGLAT
jgi:phytoene desaturase